MNDPEKYGLEFGKNLGKKNPKGISAIERLAARTILSPTGCWLYQGSPFCKHGHCKINDGPKQKIISRISWEKFVGEIPKGKWVLHRCIGTPNCWNPEHLYIGTVIENVRDCKQQGRIYDRRGEANSRTTLTNDDVKLIREMAKNLPSHVVGNAFGISSSCVRQIRNEYTWKHI